MTIADDTVALNISFVGLLLMVSMIIMKNMAFSKNKPNSRLEYKNHTLFKIKMAKSTPHIHV